MSQTRTAPVDRQHRHVAHHQCPGRCGRTVPIDRYACRFCWRRLPGELQHAIRFTASDPVLSPARTYAFTAAAKFYTAALPAGAAASSNTTST
jgi:hypothetical protein